MSGDLRAITFKGAVIGILNMERVTDIGPHTDAHGALCVLVRYTNNNTSTLYGMTMAEVADALGVSPVPPVVLESPRAVWVVAWMDSTMGDLHATVWDTPYAAGVERGRLRDDTGSTRLAETFLREVRT